VQSHKIVIASNQRQNLVKQALLKQ